MDVAARQALWSRAMRMRGLTWGWLGFGVTLLGACQQDKPDVQGDPVTAASDAPAATTAATAAPTGSAPTEEAREPAESPASLCQVEKEKVWGKWVTERTGLTVTELPNSKYAVGVAFSNRPAVLTVKPDGDATLQRLEGVAGAKVSKDLTSQVGSRDFQRVTPFVRDGKTEAFADYRDRLKDGNRRIACGPATSDEALLAFDGVPVMDQLEKDRKAAESAAPAKSAAPEPTDAGAAADDGGKARRIDARALRRLRGARDTARRREPKKLTEVRDCRTFVDQRRDRVWAVGSELVGTPQGDDYEWEMQLFVRPPNGGRVALHSAKLGKNPKTLHTLESPSAARLGDGYVLAGRYQGGALVWQLNADFKLQGAMRRYSKHPSLFRFTPDGAEVRAITSQQVTNDRWQIASQRLSSGWAASLPIIDFGAGSQAEPTLARAGSQRWLSYHTGDRRKAGLMLQAVDGDLNPQGNPHTVTQGDQQIYESVLLPLEGGRLYLVAMRRDNASAAPELVSQVLRCKAPG